MADTASPGPLSLDIEEQVARIRRAREESNKFVAEQRKLMADAQKLERDRTLAPWQIALSGGCGCSFLWGRGAAFVKLLGS